jgi:eukaryotic-like serine/threonine-protein kinase
MIRTALSTTLGGSSMAAPVLPQRLAGRYEIKEVLGKGGMGLVYRAYDILIHRDVAVKTLREIPEPAALQLFHNECNVLASLSHPNIVEIFDIGEFEDDGQKKPYFVMPLLPGNTLESLVRGASHRLTVERISEIMTQTCRGLQAAHERGLVHRDLKPSNIFVMGDDSVKIIDFGIAHITSKETTMGLKGTLLYMSPEQIELKPLSALSDIFSLSVVCYEALTGRQPFRRTREEEIAEAILREIPPPASELNPAVNQAVSRVVHKGMAKQPWHRFSTARDFSDTLIKAVRNEPIEFFDPVRIRPRLQRATRALEEGDHQFAGEILGELEAEGHIDSSIGTLREKLDRSVRQKMIAQLLDSAHARFEEEEDPLALQKLQEVLQFEPDNAAALSLKSKIDSRRSERQIETWYRLARQHIENHAYAHAREALHNVLQLKPKEKRALQLLADIERHEQEYNKIRQEKARLHRAAVDAWHNGEVSTALSKLAVVLELDRQARDLSNPELSAGYQSLYNQIRSEHDAMNNAYAEARKHIVDRNCAKALAICDTYLSKYPGNALFQALKFDVEEQERQDLSAFIATVDRQVEAEFDLDKRVNILKDALASHPNEVHFERALRLATDKRDLVNSIVARARHHEERALFAEALSDWETLKTIYSPYPGLKFEIERLQKRREQQTRTESRTYWAVQIDSSMHSGDYSTALDLLQKARSEFADDTELGELEQLARNGIQRTSEAQELIQKGQILCAEKRFDEGAKFLRQAYELDQHSSAAAAILSDALVEQARLVLDSDWQAAETLIQQALDLNPLHGLAKSMRTLVLDRKREQLVSDCVSQARKLQAADDTAGALERVEQTLAVYPHDVRLLQLRDALDKDLSQTQRRQDRRRDLEELRRLDREGENATVPSASGNLTKRAQVLANKYQNDEEFLAVAREVQRRLASTAPHPEERKRKPSTNARNATLLFSTEDMKGAQTSTLPPAGTGPILPPAKSVSFRASSTGAVLHSLRKQYLSELAEFFVAIRKRAYQVYRQAEPAIHQLKGRVTSLPRSMQVALASAIALLLVLAFVADRCLLGRKCGPSTSQAISIAASIQTSPPEAAIQLGSTLTVIRLAADTEVGTLWYDDKPAGQLESAQWTLDKIAPGDHKLKFAGPNGQVSFSFAAIPDSLPVVQQLKAANRVHVIVVSNLGDRAKLYCSFCPAQLTTEGLPPTEIGPDGTEIAGLSSGSHRMSLTQGKDQHTVNIEVGSQPTLNAFIATDQEVGTLLVVVGVDKAQVYVNGQLSKHLTKEGQLRITGLETRDYVIRVAKNGFQNAPEQRVTVQKGEETRLTFNLQPVVQMASLSIEGAIPGTEVFIDQASAGIVQPDGRYSFATLSPGDHQIELRKDGYKPSRLQKHFDGGSNVAISGGDAALQPIVGELKITFLPADANVTLALPGESPIKVTSGNVLSLPPGTYILSARIAQNVTRSSTVQVVGGESRILDLHLSPGGMGDWEVPGAWRNEGTSYVKRGGNFILYKTVPVAGTFAFNASLRKGKKLQWVLNYLDDQNYELFQMDESFFYRSQVRAGQQTEAVKFPFKSEKKQFHTFQIRVSPSSVVHEILVNGKWTVVDSWSQSGINLAAGKFGFYIPSNDEVSLADFSHYADLAGH